MARRYWKPTMCQLVAMNPTKLATAHDVTGGACRMFARANAMEPHAKPIRTANMLAMTSDAAMATARKTAVRNTTMAAAIELVTANASTVKNATSVKIMVCPRWPRSLPDTGAHVLIGHCGSFGWCLLW